jgi:hypothetical protein
LKISSNKNEEKMKKMNKYENIKNQGLLTPK